MKALIIATIFVISGCNTFNGAIDGSQQIVNSTVDSAQGMVVNTAKGVGAGSATLVEGIAKDIRSASE
jgi:predicted small secreted protein